MTPGNLIGQFSLAAFLAIAISHPAMAQTWPRLSGADIPACRQAFDLAKAVFTSDQPSTYVPVTLPRNFGSTFGLHAPEDSVTTGAALEADARTFETLDISAGSSIRHIAFWQKAPQSGWRLVVAERTFGWRGDVYALLSIDANVTRETLLAELRAHVDDDDYPYPTLMAFSWDPPVILTDKLSGQSWIVMQDTRWKLGGWSILTTETDGTRVRCTIRFEPKLRQAVFLLPAAVQRYAALLDEALGPGNNEGTLHPTANIRVATNVFWGDAALRPWALDGSAWNTHQEVLDGLRQWALRDKKRAALLAKITQQESKAVSALADYYRTKYEMPPAEAHKLASFIIGVMFRSYFVFSRGGEPSADASPNPWDKLMFSMP